MKRLLVVLLLLAIGVVGLGFYRGWFHFSSDDANQNPNATITIDKDKFRQDKEKAQEKIQEAGQAVKEKIGSGTEKTKDESSRR